MLDDTRIPPSFETRRGLNNVVTEAVALGLMSFRPLLKVLSQPVGVADIARTSKVSGPKGSLWTFSLSEPCISTSRVAMATTTCAGKMGITGGKAPTILSLPPGLCHLGWNLYYQGNGGRMPVGPGTSLKVGLSDQGPTTAVTA